MQYRATVHGEPASKANNRKIVRFGNRLASIKSDKARAYASRFATEAPVCNPLINGPVSVTLTIYYKTRRPDLDESLILDLLQGHAYENDRQVREKHIFWQLDPNNPRCDILVEARPHLDLAGPGRSGVRKPSGATRRRPVAAK